VAAVPAETAPEGIAKVEMNVGEDTYIDLERQFAAPIARD
jgi:hypothetical protein